VYIEFLLSAFLSSAFSRNYMVFGKEITLQTKGYSDIQEITRQVQEIIAESGIASGIVNVAIIGSTASVSTIEYEPALVQDVQNELDKWIPSTLHSLHSQTWGDDNGFSHIRATFMGPSITVPVAGQKALLGTWQQIIVIDHDNRPRSRRVYVQVMGEE
jgi:secondary thiamine-phosphate synthase enzyme